MLMTVAHGARLRPRSHSPVVRWIRNPLSSDSGVRIPLSAPHYDPKIAGLGPLASIVG